MTTDLTPDGLMSVREAADMVGKVEQTLRRHIKTGRLKVYTALGRDAVFKADVLRLWPKRVDKDAV